MTPNPQQSSGSFSKASLSIKKSTLFRKAFFWFIGLISFTLLGSLLHLSKDIEVTELTGDLVYLFLIVGLIVFPGKKELKPRLIRFLPWFWFLNGFSAFIIGILYLGAWSGRWIIPEALESVHPYEILWSITSSIILVFAYRKMDYLNFIRLFFKVCILDIVIAIFIAIHSQAYQTHIGQVNTGVIHLVIQLIAKGLVAYYFLKFANDSAKMKVVKGSDDLPSDQPE